MSLEKKLAGGTITDSGNIAGIYSNMRVSENKGLYDHYNQRVGSVSGGNVYDAYGSQTRVRVNNGNFCS
ncbi:MAG: hypothetical protein PF904_15175 [Kiritimatiellae bacterium]|jgi:hypothetical protein|nr:hypothetical protein [Kiritimatiellia bacterium]